MVIATGEGDQGHEEEQMRSYTEAWDRLKVAGQELKSNNVQELTHQPRNRGRLEQEKPSEASASKKERRLTATRVLAAVALVSILLTLWMGWQELFANSGRDASGTNIQLELLQGRVKSLEEERQRLANENARLSVQNEQGSIEVTRLVEELETLKSQKGSTPQRKQLVTHVERRTQEAAAAAKTGQEILGEQDQRSGRDQGSGQRAAKVATDD